MVGRPIPCTALDGVPVFLTFLPPSSSHRVHCGASSLSDFLSSSSPAPSSNWAGWISNHPRLVLSSRVRRMKCTAISLSDNRFRHNHSEASGEPVIIVNQYHPGWTLGIPFPHDEIEIVDARSGGEAADSHARISRRYQAVRQSLRCGDAACEHFSFPGGTVEVGVEHAQHPVPLIVQGIEDGLRIDLTGAKGGRTSPRRRSAPSS